MFKNKLYDSVKTYLDRYLFGFDPSQIDMSILNGSINLSNVNLRPDKVNMILQSLTIPFSLRAGTLGKLDLKVSLLQMWNGPLELTIDELFVILGTNTDRFLSHNDSYLPEGDESNEKWWLEPYDVTNMYNIFTNQLKLKNKNATQSTTTTTAGKEGNKVQGSDQESGKDDMEKTTLDFIRNLKLTINKLHVRFEDDILIPDRPYSLGLVIHHLVFETISSDQFKKLPTNSHQHFHVLKDGQNSIIKRIQVGQMSLYCDEDKRGVLIPSSLWESTKEFENQIFEAVDIKELKTTMRNFFDNHRANNHRHNLISPVSWDLQFYYQPDPLHTLCTLSFLSQLICNLSPLDASRLELLYTFSDNFLILRDLKQYRPHRKPLTNVPNHLKSHPLIKRKRQLIVRDWFFYVVWFVRLRKIVRNFLSASLSDVEQLLSQDPKYRDLWALIQDRDITRLKNKLQSDTSQQQYGNTTTKKPFKQCERGFQLQIPSIQLRLGGQELEIEAEGIKYESHHQRSKERHVWENFGLQMRRMDVHIAKRKQRVIEENKKDTSILSQRRMTAISERGDYECSPSHMTDTKVLSEMLPKHNAENMQGLKLNQVFQQNQSVLRSTNSHQNKDDQSFLGRFLQKPPLTAQDIAQGSQQKLLSSKGILQSADKKPNYNLHFSDGPTIRMPQSGIKPPMPQSNMKRSIIAASKGDSEPTAIEPSSLIGNVFNKFMGMIQTVKEEFDSSSGNLEAPAIIGSKAFQSQDSGMKPQNNMMMKKNQDLFINRMIQRPGSSIRLNDTQNQAPLTNNNSMSIMNSTRQTAPNSTFGLKGSEHLNLANKRMSEYGSSIRQNTAAHGSGLISSAQSNSDLNNILNDPMYQILMSDMNMRDMKSNLKSQQNLKVQKSYDNIPIRDENRPQIQGSSHCSTPSEMELALRQQILTQPANYKNTINSQHPFGVNGPVRAANFKEPHHHSQLPLHKGAQGHNQLKKPNLPTPVGKHSHIHDLSKHLLLKLEPSSDSQPCLHLSYDRHLNQGQANILKATSSIGKIVVDFTNQSFDALVESFVEFRSFVTMFREISSTNNKSCGQWKIDLTEKEGHIVQRRQAPLERLIELMIPLYVVKQIICKTQVQFNRKKEDNEIWNGKIQQFEHYLQLYLFDMHLSLGKVQINYHDEKIQNRKLYQFTTPDHLTCQLFKNDHDCGFDVFGFRFTGCTDLQFLNIFFINLQSQLNLFAQNPALQLSFAELKKKYDSTVRQRSHTGSNTTTNQAKKKDLKSSLILQSASYDPALKNNLLREPMVLAKSVAFNEKPTVYTKKGPEFTGEARRAMAPETAEYRAEYLQTEHNFNIIDDDEEEREQLKYQLDNLSAKDSEEALRENEMFRGMQDESDELSRHIQLSSATQGPPIQINSPGAAAAVAAISQNNEKQGFKMAPPATSALNKKTSPRTQPPSHLQTQNFKNSQQIQIESQGQSFKNASQKQKSKDSIQFGSNQLEEQMQPMFNNSNSNTQLSQTKFQGMVGSSSNKLGKPLVMLSSSGNGGGGKPSNQNKNVQYNNNNANFNLNQPQRNK